VDGLHTRWSDVEWFHQPHGLDASEGFLKLKDRNTFTPLLLHSRGVSQGGEGLSMSVTEQIVLAKKYFDASLASTNSENRDR